MRNNLYGFYCDIESNRVLHNDECVVFIPTTTTSRTKTIQSIVNPVVVNPVVKQSLVNTVVVKETNQKTTTSRTILRQDTRRQEILLRQDTSKLKIVKQDFITQNVLRITFCIFLTIILCN